MIKQQEKEEKENNMSKNIKTLIKESHDELITTINSGINNPNSSINDIFFLKYGIRSIFLRTFFYNLDNYFLTENNEITEDNIKKLFVFSFESLYARSVISTSDEIVNIERFVPFLIKDFDLGAVLINLITQNTSLVKLSFRDLYTDITSIKSILVDNINKEFKNNRYDEYEKSLNNIKYFIKRNWAFGGKPTFILLQDKIFLIPDYDPNNSLNESKYCVSGKTELTREMLKLLIEVNQGKFSTSLTNDTNFLIKEKKSGDYYGKSLSGKALKAQEKGIKMISEKDFIVNHLPDIKILSYSSSSSSSVF